MVTNQFKYISRICNLAEVAETVRITERKERGLWAGLETDAVSFHLSESAKLRKFQTRFAVRYKETARIFQKDLAL